MAEQVKAADAPAPALSFGNFADKVASPSGGFNFKAPEFNTGNQGLFGAPTKFGESADKKEGDKKEDEVARRAETSRHRADVGRPTLDFRTGEPRGPGVDGGIYSCGPARRGGSQNTRRGRGRGFQDPR